MLLLSITLRLAALHVQHANIETMVAAEQQRFDTWPDKMAKLETFAREAAETLVLVEREHQDQVCPLCALHIQQHWFCAMHCFHVELSQANLKD